MAFTPRFNIISNTPVAINGMLLKSYGVSGRCHNWLHSDKRLDTTAGDGNVNNNDHVSGDGEKYAKSGHFLS